MKHLITLLATTILLALPAARAADDHKHDKPVPGPNGGRVLEVGGKHLEFFVQPDRKIRLSFFDENMKPVAVGTETVTAVAEAPSGKAKIAFVPEGGGLLSATTLPDGDGYRIVVQVRPAPGEGMKNFRIDYHAEICGECKLAEYACTCAGHGGAGGGHSH